MKMTQKQKAALRLRNLSLFDECPADSPEIISIPGGAGKTDKPKPALPSVEELYRLFDVFNMVHFGGELPSVEIRYSERMLIAGTYTPGRKLIKIGRRYHEIFPEEVEDTLMHEMIHIKYPDHDAKFKAVAKRLGVSLKAHDHPALRAPYNYLYACPHCGKEYPRRRKYYMASCGVCSTGSKFDPRYKLVLKSAKKR